MSCIDNDRTTGVRELAFYQEQLHVRRTKGNTQRRARAHKHTHTHTVYYAISETWTPLTGHSWGAIF